MGSLHLFLLFLLASATSCTQIQVVEVMRPCEPFLRWNPHANKTLGVYVSMWNLLKQTIGIEAKEQLRIDNIEEFIGFCESLSKGPPPDIPHVFISCTTITEDRSIRRQLDFSYPLIVEDIVLMSLEGVGMSEQNVMGFIAAVMYYFTFCFVGGFIYYAVEYVWLEETQDMSRLTKIVDCVYFSFITASTVGFGDITPKTRIGRVFSILWISTSLIMISTLTSLFLMALSTQDRAHLIDDPSKLRGALVGCHVGSVFQERWKALGMRPCVPYASKGDEVSVLVSGTAKYILQSEFRINQLITENKNLVLIRHPLILMTSQLALFTHKGNNLTKEFNAAISAKTLDISNLELALLNAVSSKQRSIPSVFDYLASNEAIFPAVSILGCFVIFFSCGVLWLKFKPPPPPQTTNPTKSTPCRLPDILETLAVDVNQMINRNGEQNTLPQLLHTLRSEMQSYDNKKT